MDYLSLCERIQLSFAVCRIGIYTNSGTHLCAHRIGQTAANFIFFNGCFRTLCCKGPPPPRPEYDVVCVGLMGSGKTSLLTHLCSESPDNIVPTTGFSIKAVPFQNAILNVKELGGAANIRKYWSRYYQGSQGVIFVLDSATSEDDLEIARNELHSALQHPQLCTLPFLILAHHQDKPAARSVQENVLQMQRSGLFLVLHTASVCCLNSFFFIGFRSKNILNLNHWHVESAGFFSPVPWMIWKQ
ncbi:ADP-ribosylation factor-like protein 15 isoform X3 [Rhinatrema bivittatum]|uniref:ADP-ribosylation factor-like protein 15 isoform X3 n=1 Tax=Rhinatrema bivittatum TaxID=194408 RepID=UPI00112DBA85|nr:ADP-ribosylation factor-like protein 15 isoform X3 [Rhinatrema bivittatum]